MAKEMVAKNFDFGEEYILENDRALLRPLELSDRDAFLPYSVSEPEIWTFNSAGANGVENLDKYVVNAIRQRQDEREYPFTVIDKNDQSVAGSTRFYAILLENKTIEIGYTWYAKRYQRTGLNKHCKFLLLKFAFEDLGMERVAFAVNSKNEASLNAVKSIGGVLEGTLRNCHTDASGNRIDVARLSILKSEWHDVVKDSLLQRLSEK